MCVFTFNRDGALFGSTLSSAGAVYEVTYEYTQQISVHSSYFSSSTLTGIVPVITGEIVANNVPIRWQSTDKEVISWLSGVENITTATSSGNQPRLSKGQIAVAVLVPIICLFILVGFVLVCLARRRQRRRQSLEGM
jgi:hypothetical protein